MTRLAVEPCIRIPAQLGEGPRWIAALERLLWVDLEGGELHLSDPAAGATATYAFDRRVTAAAPCAGGALLVALADEVCRFDPGTGARETLAPLPQPPDVRLNDGACDPAGRFWVGSMAYDLRPDGGRLYRLVPDTGTLDVVLPAVTLSNGLGWSPDGRRMYHVDSLAPTLTEYRYDLSSGTIGDPRVLVRFERGEIPDGIAVDGGGAIWVALYGAGELRRFDPAGRLDRVVALPTPNVTACAFGGPAGDVLFVTTGAGPDAQAGWVFALEPGVTGPAAVPFAA